jgi:hypothetical protein
MFEGVDVIRTVILDLNVLTFIGLVSWYLST